VIAHDSQQIPTYPQAWDRADVDWIWFSWASVLNGATILTSTWSLPDGWAEEDSETDQTVTVDGTDYTHANGVLLSTTAARGTYLISNTVTLSGSRTLQRSVRVVLSEQ
jgi:hypothetical protein